MRSETDEHVLEHLAAAPVPGGGAVAALHAALGAALVVRIADHSAGDRPEHAQALGRVREDGRRLRVTALELAGADGPAVEAVLGARALPEDEPGGADTRARAVGEALTAAGRLAARVVRVAEEVLALAETVRPAAHRGVVAEVAVAAEALRAAAGTARITLEVHLGGIIEPAVREELLDAVEDVDDLVLRAAKLTAAVREQILR